MNKEYDKRGNLIHGKWLGLEYWYEYDENNNQIHFKNSNNEEYWYKFDKLNNNPIKITKQEYKNIEYNKKIKEYNSRTKCSRFELIEI